MCYFKLIKLKAPSMLALDKRLKYPLSLPLVSGNDDKLPDTETVSG